LLYKRIKQSKQIAQFYFFLAWEKIFLLEWESPSLERESPRLSKTVPGPCLPRRDYSRLSENNSLPDRKISRLDENSLESTLVLGPFFLSDYTLAWTKHLSLGRNTSRLGKTPLAWAKTVQRAHLLQIIPSWARLLLLERIMQKTVTPQINYAVITTSKLPDMPQMTKLSRIQLTYMMVNLP